MKVYTLLIKYGNKLYELIYETPYLTSIHRGFPATPEVFSLLKTSILTPEWIPFKSSGTVVLSQIELHDSITFETTHNPLSYQLRQLPAVMFQPTQSIQPLKFLIEVSRFSNFISQRDLTYKEMLNEPTKIS